MVRPTKSLGHWHGEIADQVSASNGDRHIIW